MKLYGAIGSKSPVPGEGKGMQQLQSTHTRKLLLKLLRHTATKLWQSHQS